MCKLVAAPAIPLLEQSLAVQLATNLAAAAAKTLQQCWVQSLVQT
jgi:hypothetical protein